jgi:tetratricopeptide (TPR) repeat protein
MNLKVIFKGTTYIVAALVALATVVVYLPSLQNEFVAWDDWQYICRNPHITSLDTRFLKWAIFDFYEANWHPLTWLSHAIDYAIWRLNPMGHHLTSVILHGLNTFLVIILIVNLLRVASSFEEVKGFLSDRRVLTVGIITGLLFGLHPIHVESVAWVSERKDVLCAFFFLLSILAYIRYVSGASPPPHPSSLPTGERIKPALSKLEGVRGIRWYLFSLGFFFLALLSKPMAVTLPVVLLIMDWYPFRRIEGADRLKPIFIEKFPFFALSLVSAILTLLAQSSGGSITSMKILPLSIRIFVGFKALIAYLGKMILPIELIPFYPYPQDISLLSFEYLLPLLLMIGITAACIVLSRKRRVWLAIWGYYVLTLFPVLGIIQVGRQAMADRYTYLPSLGPFLIIGLGVTWLFESLNTLKRWNLFLKTINLSIAAIVIFFMLFASIKQIGVWKNGVVLWTYVIEKNIQKVPMAYYNRGVAYERMGQYDKAIEDYNRAITLNPNYVEAYCNRGGTYEKMDQYDKAIEDYNRAITLNPNYIETYYNRGVTYEKMDQYDKAIEDYNRAITLNPNYIEAYYNRGVAYEKMGQYNKAIENYSIVINLNPNDFEAYNNRGVTYSKSGRYEEALIDLTEAIGLSPNSSELYFNRGNIYMSLGRFEEALKDFTKSRVNSLPLD